MIDNVGHFMLNPSVFIIANPIVLNSINQNLIGGIPAINNLRTFFSLSTNTVHGVPGLLDFPTLRMQPIGAAPVVHQPGGGVLNTIDAMYCRAANGGDGFNIMPFCDISTVPVPADAHFLFTTGMNGCSMIIASAVPVGAAPLAPGSWRILHDHDHRSIAAWVAAGYTVQFACYADIAEAGIIGPHIHSYNPNNYPWGYDAGAHFGFSLRIVTNFLYWNGANWSFNSRHYHASGIHILNVDSPPAFAGATSTQTIII